MSIGPPGVGHPACCHRSPRFAAVVFESKRRATLVPRLTSGYLYWTILETFLSKDKAGGRAQGYDMHDSGAQALPIDDMPLLTQLFTTSRVLPLGVPTELAACNPTVINAGSALLILVRIHNYRLDSRGHIEHIAGPEICSYNWIIKTTHNGQLLEAGWIDDSLIRTLDNGRVGPNGLEDCRLYSVGTENFVLGSARNDSLNTNTMVRARLENLRLVDVAMFPSPVSSREKNWMPVQCSAPPAAIYSVSPLMLVTLGAAPVEIEELHDNPQLRGYSGSSQVINCDDHFLCVVHRRLIEDEVVYYVHRFLLFDSKWKLAASSPDFFLQHRGIEFCAGIARIDRGYVLAYGVNDGAASLMWLSEEHVDTLLGMGTPE